MINECPCQGCTKRKVGCHGYCVDYKKWSLVQKQISKREKEMRARTYSYIDWNCTRKY